MSLVSRGYGEATLTDAAIVYGGAGLISVLMVWWLRSVLSQQSLPASELRSLIVAVACFGLLFRLLAMLTYPVLEDDFYRYMWDGWVFADTGTPYGIAPSDYFASGALSEVFESILDGINYPDVPTVYGPTLQLLFALGYLIAPGSIWPLQLAAGLADIALMLVLAKLIDDQKHAVFAREGLARNAQLHLHLHLHLQLLCFALYAWSPLAIKEFSTTAHPDILGALLVVLAFLLRQRAQWLAVGAALALAVGVKPFALIFAPFLIGFNVRAIGSFALTVVLISLPFVGGDLSFAQSFVAIWLPEGLRAMGGGWLFNSGFYELAGFLGITEQSLLRQLALLSFALVWAVQLWRALKNQISQQQLATTLVWLFGVFLLLLPTLNPWYLAWWLPFAVISPAVTPWVASFAVLLSYAIPLNAPGFAGGADVSTDLYQVPGWVLLIEFGAIALAVAFDVRRFRQRSSGLRNTL